jgi:hypothetical protein
LWLHLYNISLVGEGKLRELSKEDTLHRMSRSSRSPGDRKEVKRIE